MLKAEVKQEKYLGKKTGKYIASLCGITEIGETKEEAEINLEKKINWLKLLDYRKVYQYKEITWILSKGFNVNQYLWEKYINGKSEGSTTFSAVTEREAENKVKNWVFDYVQAM